VFEVLSLPIWISIPMSRFALLRTICVYTPRPALYIRRYLMFPHLLSSPFLSFFFGLIVTVMLAGRKILCLQISSCLALGDERKIHYTTVLFRLILSLVSPLGDVG